MNPSFDPACRACPRLARFLAEVRQAHPHYHAAPVPAFGDDAPRLLIIGLAPGMHGANRTGRPFTGDYAGILLFRTLFELGLSNQPEATSIDDKLVLHGVRITNAVKCLPPQNKPNAAEVRRCNPYLRGEIHSLPISCRLLALGRIAHEAVLRAYALPLTHHRFVHGARHQLPDGRLLFDSYHCSRYNTQTGRLSPAMFREVIRQALNPLSSSTRP
ncbi:MAG: uracil-DNA glycosylase [Zetaproteobacteria bacterium]|nr:MAG: uracil-DNA glycosylase [Zetaproteobacteria bacterium]